MQYHFAQSIGKTLSRVSDKKMTKSRARLTSYSRHHIKTLGTRLTSCSRHHIKTLGTRLTSYSRHHIKTLGTRLTSYSRHHIKTLGTRLTSYSRHHIKTLGTRLTSYSRHHIKTLGTRLTSCSRHHITTLGTRLTSYSRHHIKTLGTRLTSYSRHHIKTLGTTNLTCVYKNVEHNVQCFVTEMDSTAILGVEACQRLGLIERLCSVGVDITEEYADSFKGFVCLPGEYKIKLDPSVPPVVHAPRKVPVALHVRVKEELQRMENDGVIKKQEEPTDWVNSMVIVETPKKLRICTDPRDLNKAIKREHFPMKAIEEVVQNMPGAKVFSKLDATSGYWQLKLDEESSKLCTFNIPFGRYRFLRVPFGIVSASEIFQRVMSQMVEDIEGSEAIMDDIVVWGKDQAEHDMCLKQVMDKAKACGLKFNKGKCRFRQNQFSYVEHVLSGEGLKADPEKIRAVQDMKRPQSQRELMTFLGFIQYLKKFMPNMADISAPLRKLIEKAAEWKWTETEENSFNKLKKTGNRSSSTQVLRPYITSHTLSRLVIYRPWLCHHAGRHTPHVH